MTKSKHQLRAEAVERLSDMALDTGSAVKKLAIAIDADWNPDNTIASMGRLRAKLLMLLTDDELTVRNEASDDELFCCSYCHCKVYNVEMTEGDCGWGLTFCPQCGGEVDEGDSRRIESKLDKPTNVTDDEEHLRNLTKMTDEPPEGDAVSIMREAEENISVRLKAFGYEPKSLTKLADMVERDYVPQANYRNLCKHLGKMQRERDEWKAKAEAASDDGVKRSMTNLEWLYASNYEFHRIANVFAAGETDDDAHGWLLSPHVDDDGQIADMSEKEPDCVRNGGEVSDFRGSWVGSKVGSKVDESYRQYADLRERSETADCESDTREKLKSDAYNLMCDVWRKGFNCANGSKKREETTWTYAEMRDLLDRQAAITERECMTKAGLAATDAPALQAKVDELTRESDGWRDACKARRLEIGELERKLAEMKAAHSMLCGAFDAMRADCKLHHVKAVRCGACEHSRIERHTGDEHLVCWRRPTHGEIVERGHYCGYGKKED